MAMSDAKILLIGIGNYGREDDALGWLFLDEIQKQFGDAFDYEYRYQLQIEDAELVSHYKSVFFIDASISQDDNPYSIKPVKAIETHHFTTHELPPETVLYLCKTVYNKLPDVKIIAIFGKNYELKIGVSDTAKINLKKSLTAFYDLLKLEYKLLINGS